MLPPFVHTFTHFKRAVQPLRIDVRAQPRAVADTEALRWVNAETRSTLGLPQPVRKLLERIEGSNECHV